MFSRGLSFTATACALLVLIAVGLVSGPAALGPGEQNAEAAILGEVKKLLASDAQAGDVFGISVAVSGETAIVGAFDQGSAGSGAGAAYVFRRDQGGADSWGEVKKLTASDTDFNDQFGVSVALRGDTAIVGAQNRGCRVPRGEPHARFGLHLPA